MPDTEQIARARAIATYAHSGQIDRVGAPYIGHPARVAARLAGESAHAQAAGWLHDVIEDCGITAVELTEIGVSPAVVRIVELLTRQKGVSDEEYYAAIRQHPIARIVKLADIVDNTDPARASLLDDSTRERLRRKYLHALEQLGATSSGLYRRLANEEPNAPRHD